MTDGQEKIAVQIKYKGIEKEFTATLENAWLLLKRFFSEFIPSFEIANSLWLTVDLNQLAKSCQGLIAFSKDGPSLMVSNSRLTDNETLLLWLLAQHLGHELGILTRDFVTKPELKFRLGKSAKIASTRLGELVKNGSITKVEAENFRITILGVVQMQKELLPRIKAKLVG